MKTTFLRGGLGNNVVATRTTKPSRKLTDRQIEEIRAKREAMFDAEAAAEAAAIRRHREIRPDVQKIAF